MVSNNCLVFISNLLYLKVENMGYISNTFDDMEYEEQYVLSEGSKGEFVWYLIKYVLASLWYAFCFLVVLSVLGKIFSNTLVLVILGIVGPIILIGFIIGYMIVK